MNKKVLEKRIIELEKENEYYKNKLKLFNELQNLLETSTNITQKITSSEQVEESYFSKSLNEMLKKIKKITNFNGIKIKSVFIFDEDKKTVSPFSRRLYNQTTNKRIIVSHFKGFSGIKDFDFEDTSVIEFPKLYAYVLNTGSPFQFWYDIQKLKKDEENGLIGNLKEFLLINRIVYLKEILNNLYELLNKPAKILEIKSAFEKFKRDKEINFFNYLLEKTKEIKKHSGYNDALKNLFKEKRYYSHFGKWFRKLFFPVGKFLVLEFYFYDKEMPIKAPLSQGEIELCNMVVKFLEIPLTSIYLINKIENQNEELKEAYKKLKEAQEEKLRYEKYARDEHIAGGMAHEMGNKLFPVEVNLLIASGKGSEKEFILPLAKEIEEFSDYLNENIEIFSKDKILNQMFEKYKSKIAPSAEKLKKLDDLLKDSHRNIRMAQEVVVRLLEFAKIGAKKGEKRVKLLEVIENIISNYEEIFKKYNIKISFNKKSEGFVLSNPEHMHTLFENLIKNAIEALENKQEKNIYISIFENENFVITEIRDNGNGIPKEFQSKIFNPFFSTKPSKGTGLGLAIVERIVYEYGGKIELNSELGLGTEFKIYLPLARNEGLKNE